MKYKKVTSALISAGALSLAAVPGAAFADVMASSVVTMTNFTLHKEADGVGAAIGAQISTSDLAALSFTGSFDLTGSLTGTAGFALSGNTATDGQAPLLPAVQCVGSGCGALALGEDTFPKLTGPALGNYAAGDARETGTPITGLSGYPAIPAEVKNASYAALTSGSGAGSVDSNNNLQASFTFISTVTTFLGFNFTADAYLQALVTGDERFPSFATASYEFSFSLACTGLNAGGTFVGCAGWPAVGIPIGLPLVPTLELAPTVSINAPNPGGISLETILDLNPPAAYSVTFPFILTAGTQYQLSGRINTNVDIARVVPEPGVLSLLGLGLLGVGVVARRKMGSA